MLERGQQEVRRPILTPATAAVLVLSALAAATVGALSGSATARTWFDTPSLAAPSSHPPPGGPPEVQSIVVSGLAGLVVGLVLAGTGITIYKHRCRDEAARPGPLPAPPARLVQVAPALAASI